MKLLFKNTTQFSKDIYKTFLTFHSKTYDLPYFLYTFTILLLLLFCIVSQIVSYNYHLAAIYIVIFLVFLFWRFFHPINTVKKEYNSEKITKESKISYLFFNKYYIVNFNNSSKTLYYRNIRRVFETDTFFYFYLDKTHAFLINKDTFTLRSIRRLLSIYKKENFL